jgi:hypothetical protein
MEATLTHQVMDEGESVENHTRARSPRLAWPGLVWARQGGAGWGEGRGRTTCTWMVQQNSAPRLAGMWHPFVILSLEPIRLR